MKRLFLSQILLAFTCSFLSAQTYTMDYFPALNFVKYMAVQDSLILFADDHSVSALFPDGSIFDYSQSGALPACTVTKLVSAENGALLSTSVGIFRYTGLSPVYWEHVIVTGADIVSVIQSPDSAIWYTTSAGSLHRYYNSNTQYLLFVGGLCALDTDTSGNIVCCGSGKICRYVNGIWEIDSVGTFNAESVVVDDLNRTWIFSMMKSFRYDGDTLLSWDMPEFQKYPLQLTDGTVITGHACTGLGFSTIADTVWTMTGVTEGLMNGHVWSIAQKPDGEVLLGTSSGIIRWNNGVVGHVFLPGPFSPTVNSIAGSLSDELWVASTAGLAKLKQGEWSHFSFSNPLLGGDFAVNSVCVDHNGIVWAGTQGAGVFMFDGLSWVNITAMDGLPSNTIYDIMEDHNGDIWFGTVSGVCIFNGSGYSYLTTLDGLVGSNVHCIFEDSGNRIWMGTCSGVSCWNGVNFANYNMSDGLPSNYINAIAEENGMWFGTNAGLARRDSSGFTNYTTSDGLTSNIVRDIAVAGPGLLFLANEPGYNVGYPSTGWVSGTMPLGLNSCLAAWKADDGDVWMGGYTGGILRFSDIVSGIPHNKIPDHCLGWPNPATSDFYLAVPDSYVLYDSFGNTVKHSDSITETIPLSDLPAGIYYVRTSDGNQKIIKL